MEYLVSNEQDMRDVVLRVLSKLENRESFIVSNTATILALNGDLGSGKTTFTKMLARELGIQEHITSPTFVIQKSYNIPKTQITTPKPCFGVVRYDNLVHIDAYRLSSGEDMNVLDFKDTIKNKKNLIAIEWAENIKSSLPSRVVNMRFEYVDETTRRVTVDT